MGGLDDGRVVGYEPDYPSLRNEVMGYWSTVFDGFEQAVTWQARLNATFGMDADAAVETAVRWAMRHGYFPLGYRKPIYTTNRIEDIKARLKLEDVLSRLTELRGRGDTLTGRCPFHDDSNPSLVVWTKIQKFKCYGCGERGDVVDVLQKAGITDA
jgi:hypothetical protein